MSIEPLNFSNNKYELTGNEQNTVTQKKDTINNVMNPDNRIVEDESYKTNSEADKEKTKSDEGEKLSFKDRWQNLKGKLHKILHKEKKQPKDKPHIAEK